jgi:hypothetical protein
MSQELDQLDRSSAPDQAQSNRLLKGGVGGALFAAVCCLTPLLVVALAGAGLSAVTGWLDYALFPLLFFSLAVVAQALWLRAARPGPSPKIWAALIAVLLSALIIVLEFRGALTLILLALALTGAYAHFLNRLSKQARRLWRLPVVQLLNLFAGLLSMVTPLLAAGAVLYLVFAKTKTLPTTKVT